MGRLPIKALVGGLLLMGSPSWASYVSSQPLVGGAVAIVNTVSGVISICYRYGNDPPRCVSAGSFVPASANVRIVGPHAGQIFHVYDAVTGKVMHCQVDLQRVSRVSSGWSCLQSSARLP